MRLDLYCASRSHKHCTRFRSTVALTRRQSAPLDAGQSPDPQDDIHACLPREDDSAERLEGHTLPRDLERNYTARGARGGGIQHKQWRTSRAPRASGAQQPHLPLRHLHVEDSNTQEASLPASQRVDDAHHFKERFVAALPGGW